MGELCMIQKPEKKKLSNDTDLDCTNNLNIEFEPAAGIPKPYRLVGCLE